jgi:Holliday junction resolvasome RuvABC DNA-binding subunit
VGPAQPARSPLSGASEEAVSALVNLGYRRPEAERAVQRVMRNGESLEEVIRAALQGLAG